MELNSKKFLLQLIVPRLIGPRLEYISSSGKRIHFAEIAKQSKNEIQGKDKCSHTYSYSFIQW